MTPLFRLALKSLDLTAEDMEHGCKDVDVVTLTLALLALITGLIVCGVLPIFQGIVVICCVQLIAFAMSTPQPALYITGLTPDQVQEFQEIVKDLKAEWSNIKILPESFDRPELKVNEIRRASMGFTGGVPRAKGKISDDAARALAATVILNCSRQGKLEAFLPDTRTRERFFAEAKSVINMRALTTDEIPLPTAYSGQIIELIAEFGVVRDEMFGYPLSGGISRPPRMGTRPAFGSITMSDPFPEKKPTIDFCSMSPHKLGGIVIMPRELDDQSIVPMGQFLAQYGAVEFARAEDTWGFLADGSGCKMCQKQIRPLIRTHLTYSESGVEHRTLCGELKNVEMQWLSSVLQWLCFSIFKPSVGARGCGTILWLTLNQRAACCRPFLFFSRPG